MQTSPDPLQGTDDCAVPPDPRSFSKRPTPRNHLRISAQRAEQMITRRVAPVYPPLARAARVQGKVELQVKVDKCGAVSEVRPLTGHPMLMPSATEAVRQWRFRPYLENGKPAGMETILTVNFSMPVPVR